MGINCKHTLFKLIKVYKQIIKSTHFTKQYSIVNTISSIRPNKILIKGLNNLALSDDNLDLLPTINAWGECELAIVIKHELKNINISNVHEGILGFMPANDITCSNFHGRDHHLARSKSADGFCTVGKYINIDYEYHNKKILACLQ